MVNVETDFVELMRAWLVSLPHDMKIAFDAMDDENLAREDRELAAAAMVHIFGKADPVKARREPVAFFADDAVMLHLALRRIADRGNEDAQAFTERFPELFEDLASGLATCKSHLAKELYDAVEARVACLPAAMRAKKVAQYLDNDEARESLYEKMLEFRTNYPIDETLIVDKLKRSATVIEALRKTYADEARATA